MRPTPASPPGPSGLPRALLQAAKLSQQQIDTLQRDASNERTPFIDHLIRSGEMDAKAKALAEDDPDDFVEMFNPVTREWNGPRFGEPTKFGDWAHKGRATDFE